MSKGIVIEVTEFPSRKKEIKNMGTKDERKKNMYPKEELYPRIC